MHSTAFARGAVLFGLLASGPFWAGSAGAQIEAPGVNARERSATAQAAGGDFIRAYIDANGGCSAWNSMLRTPEWARGAPFGKRNTEWTDADFRELEAILWACIDQTMGRQLASNPEYADQIKRGIRNDIQARRQQVARTAGQDQRQGDARAAAERAVQDTRSTAEARRQEEARTREQRLQEALARREEQARQAQAGQVRLAEEKANAFLAQEAARRQQEQQPQQGRLAPGQPRTQQIAPGLQGLTNAAPDARQAYCAVSPANTGRTAGSQLFLARFLNGREAAMMRDTELPNNPPSPGERLWVLVDKIDQYYPDVPALRLDISGYEAGDDTVAAVLPAGWLDQMAQSGKTISVVLDRDMEGMKRKEPFRAFFGDLPGTMRSIVPMVFWQPCMNELRAAAGQPRDRSNDAFMENLGRSHGYIPFNSPYAPLPGR